MQNNQIKFSAQSGPASGWKQTEIGPIPEDWEIFNLGKIATFSQGLQVPINEQFFKKSNNTCRFIRIVDYTNPTEPHRFVNCKANSRYYINKKNIAMIRYGSQTAGKIITGYEGIIANNLFKVNCFKTIKEKYLYYYLNQESVYNLLNGSQSSSTMPAITFNHLSLLPIPIPPLLEQQKIAEVLGALDDKIELNRKMNKTLESLAQTIFKKWFIGTNNKTFKDIAQVVTGKRPASKVDIQDENNDIPIIGAGGIMGYTNESIPYDQEIIVTGRVGTHGMVQRIDDSCWTSDNTLVTISDYPNFTYYLMKTFDFNSLNRGSTQPLITQTDLQNYPIYLPEKKEIEKFESIISSFFEKISLNNKMIQTLSQIRDSLLPRLMSGKLKVR